MTRSSPGPTNIDNISKKISSGIGALNRVRPFIKTHGATKIHQALTLNDKRKSKSSKNGREIHTCTYSCCFVYKTYCFFCICFFLVVSAFALLFSAAAIVFSRSCCCRVVGSRSEFENVAKKLNLRSSSLYRGDYCIKSRGVQKMI